MQKKIKICHIISAFYRYDTRIFWKQCRSLQNAGYEVILLTNDSLSAETKEGVKILPSGFKYSSRIERILFARRSNFKKAAELSADIYQIHDPEFIPIGLKLKRKGKCVVYDSHEDFPRQILEKEWIPKIFRKFLSKIAEYYFAVSLKKFDAIVTVTPHIASGLNKISKNVRVVTNYPLIEQNFVSFSEGQYIKRGNLLCYAGTVYRSTLQENLFKALSGMNDLKYRIIGTMDESYKTELSVLDFFKQVVFIDYVPRQVLDELYKESSIGLAIFDYSPNLGYKTGSLGVNKIFEYMYFGLPVVCTDFILWKEIIDTYNCGIYVNPHNIDEIRNAIRYLMENKAEAYKMGQNGRLAVLKEYNWNSQKDIYLKVYSEIAAKT